MEPKLYYTKEELMAIPHFNIIETETNLYLHQNDSKFNVYKKLFLLKPDAPELTEIYLELNLYIVVKDYLSGSRTRFMNEFNGWLFFSIKDYMEQLEFANKNKLF